MYTDKGLSTYHIVSSAACFLYCGCFNLFCNVGVFWYCVYLYLLCSVLLVLCYLYCFMYLYSDLSCLYQCKDCCHRVTN